MFYSPLFKHTTVIEGVIQPDNQFNTAFFKVIQAVLEWLRESTSERSRAELRRRFYRCPSFLLLANPHRVTWAREGNKSWSNPVPIAILNFLIKLVFLKTEVIHINEIVLLRLHNDNGDECCCNLCAKWLLPSKIPRGSRVC